MLLAIVCVVGLVFYALVGAPMLAMRYWESRDREEMKRKKEEEELLKKEGL